MNHIILLITHNLNELEDFYDDHDDTDYEFSHDHPYADELPTQVVGKNHKQNSAHMHVTGQSRYFDDIPYAVNEGFLAPVLSERPHAKAWFKGSTSSRLFAHVRLAQSFESMKDYFDRLH